MNLDSKLSIHEHIADKMNKAMKGIGILRKLQFVLPPSSSLTIYRSFMRPHLNYEDVIYDQPSDKSFLSRIMSIQYNAALSIT